MYSWWTHLQVATTWKKDVQFLKFVIITPPFILLDREIFSGSNLLRIYCGNDEPNTNMLFCDVNVAHWFHIYALDLSPKSWSLNKPINTTKVEEMIKNVNKINNKRENMNLILICCFVMLIYMVDWFHISSLDLSPQKRDP